MVIDKAKQLRRAIPFCLTETNLVGCLGVTDKYQGKVRDVYLDRRHEFLYIVTTDRLSAFDRMLAAIPYKGQVLNQISEWWFDKTKHIIPNHKLGTCDPNIMVVRPCKVFPIEFVVRGYITGTTNTSLWTIYNKGDRQYCGHDLPEGLRKNQRLDQAILTPTTKDKEHDRPISAEEIIKEGWMTAEDWEVTAQAAMRLYEFGVETAAKHGLILVDTKYEFGRDELTGDIRLIDEVHTPDSSRYWLANTYEERFANHQEPENIDKEFLRLWFAKNCDPYKDTILPAAPEELVIELSSRYIQLYEMITGLTFEFPYKLVPPDERMKKNIQQFIELIYLRSF